MQDHIWLFKPYVLYDQDRYILMLGPDRGKNHESASEKKISDLQEYVEDRVNKSDSDMIKRLATFEEQLIALQSQQTFGQQDAEATFKDMNEVIIGQNNSVSYMKSFIEDF